MKNSINRKTSTLLLVILLLLSFPTVSQAARAKYTIKIASLAPEGSVWTNHFRNFAREVTEKSNGEIKFKIYPGGVMGDDRAMYRKMKIGQLHGGGFTMSGIGQIVPDFRVLGIPMLFNSYEEVDLLIEKLFPSFQESFEAKGLELLAMTEVGFVHTMSATPIENLDQMRSGKCWAPSNDPLGLAFFQDIGITPIQLSIPDVLPSLQTGLVNTIFNSFYGSLVLQWFTKTKYITDTPFLYAYGGVIFSKKMMDKLPAHYATMVREQATKHFAGLLADTRKGNIEALQAMKDHGIKVVKATDQAVKELYGHQEQTVKQTIGKSYSREIYEEMSGLLSEIRRSANAATD